MDDSRRFSRDADRAAGLLVEVTRRDRGRHRYGSGDDVDRGRSGAGRTDAPGPHHHGRLVYVLMVLWQKVFQFFTNLISIQNFDRNDLSSTTSSMTMPLAGSKDTQR